jgi:hypothetical protein
MGGHIPIADQGRLLYLSVTLAIKHFKENSVAQIGDDSATNTIMSAPIVIRSDLPKK